MFEMSTEKIKAVNEGDILWEPSANMVEGAQITHYTNWLRNEYDKSFDIYSDLHAWSVDKNGEFWDSIWRYFEIISDTPYTAVVQGEISRAAWFEGAKVNYAEHVLRAARHGGDEPAILGLKEGGNITSMTWFELASNVRKLASSMRSMGVGSGDRVAAYLPNSPEAVIALLATVAIGAIWSSTALEFGTGAVVDRLAQIAPKLIFVADGYRFNGNQHDRRQAVEEIIKALPSLEQVVLVPQLNLNVGSPNTEGKPSRRTFDELMQGEPVGEKEFVFERVSHDHPLWVLYSSGTTGLPKAIMHSHVGMLVSHYVVNNLHLNISTESRLFFYTTTGWMMFNSVVSALLCGSSIITYDGSPTYPNGTALWRLASEARATVFGASPTYIQVMDQMSVRPKDEFDLSALELILLSGSPAQPEHFAWFHDNVKPDLWVGSSSGGTDICGAIVGALPTLPVRAGRIQCPILGIDVHAFDSENRSVVDEVGELVIASPAPCMPLGFWNDERRDRYVSAYFKDIPGVWRHGDFIRISSDLSSSILGRSDSTLNRHGVRIGTAEIYRCVEQVDGVRDSLVVALERSPGHYTMELFIALMPGWIFDQDLVNAIKAALRSNCSPRHIPDEIHAVQAIPYTLSGKKMEVPVRRILQGEPVSKVASVDAMKDPRAIDEFIKFKV
jgi:acetoacetyl-CoA synthetase